MRLEHLKCGIYWTTVDSPDKVNVIQSNHRCPTKPVTLQNALAFQRALALEAEQLTAPTTSATLHYKPFISEEPVYHVTDLELRLGIDTYLAGLPYSMWSDWEIKRPERRKLAAKWLYEVMRDVFAVIGEGMEDGR